MARLIKCPRCDSQLDVSNIAGGTTMRCTDCGAMLRVPTGTTGQYQKVPSSTQPAVQQSPSGSHAKVGGRSTALFKKMSGVKAPGATNRPPRGGGEDRRGAHSGGRRGSGAGLMIGVGGGIAAVIIVLVIAMAGANSSKENAKLEKEAYRKKVEQQNRELKEKERLEDIEYEKQLAAQKEAEKAGKKTSSLKKTGAGKYEAPPTFEPGAGKQATKAADHTVDPGLLKEYEGLATSGKIADIVKEDNKWFPALLSGLLSDNETIARSSFQALADICVKNKISSSEDGYRNPITIEYFNSAYYRAGTYTQWVEWWQKGQNKSEIAARGGAGGDRENARVVGEDPARAKWDEIMQFLRAGGGYDDPKRPEGMAFAKVKNMGEGAYPYLVKYIENEDIMLARAAVKVLNELLGKEVPLPNEGNKMQIKTQMENLIKK